MVPKRVTPREKCFLKLLVQHVHESIKVFKSDFMSFNSNVIIVQASTLDLKLFNVTLGNVF
jgi:hypothetical protein